MRDSKGELIVTLLGAGGCEGGGGGEGRGWGEERVGAAAERGGPVGDD